MDKSVNKYVEKLYKQGLAERDAPLFSSLGTELEWNKNNNDSKILKKIFDYLNVNSLLFSIPAEPYKTIINYLTSEHLKVIQTEDCETRIILQDLPITDNFDAVSISKILKKRKCTLIRNKGIITSGAASPEQAYVNYSTVCFACFIKFFSDYLKYKKSKKINTKLEKTFNNVIDRIPFVPDSFPPLMKSPFNEEKTYKAIIQAGKMVVDYKLVDSYFGNISYLLNNTIYISKTACALDELEKSIVPCPINNTSYSGTEASSELSAHKHIFLETDNKAILHGHPKFSIILSLDCDKNDCKYKGQCYIKCPEKRLINNTPIIPGEVGTGKYGLYKTLPKAIKGKKGVIVHGHGVFTVGKNDFNEAFNNLLQIEKECQKEYFDRINNI